jgi:glycosyltransferase involved in cell wall biosynthesis
VGFERVPRGLCLDGLEVRYIDGPEPNLWLKAHRKLLVELDMAPRRAVRLIQREHATLIHVHFATDAVVFWPAIQQTGLPLVVTLHGSDINIHPESWKKGTFRPSFSRFPERLLRMARQPQVFFVAVSEAIKRRAVEYGIQPERITVRYIGIDLSRFKFCGVPVSRRLKRILFVGRLVPKKGAEVLIRAFARVREAVPDAQLIIVGTGPLAPHLANLAAKLGTPVEFRGSLPHKDVKKEMDRARVLCLPSISAPNGDAEGLGMVILEAQACGVPVVTSARGGASEAIIDGATGFAFNEGNVNALAQHLTRLLLDDELAEAMSREGMRHVAEKFEIRACTADLETLYDTITDEHLKSGSARSAAVS